MLKQSCRRAVVLTAIAGAVLATGAQAAEFGFFDVRSAAMGNTGVASGTLSNGGYHNPALLAAQEEKEDFSIILPTLGAHVGDPSDLVSDVDAFQEAFVAGQAAEAAGDAAALAAAIAAMQAALASSSGKAFIANAGGGVALGFAGKEYAGGLLINAYTLNSLRITADTVNFIPVSSNTSQLDFRGIQVVEIGIPLAKRFDLGGQKIAVGLTPKYVKVKTNEFSVLLATASDSDFTESATTQPEETGFNVDVGASWGIGNGWRAGLVGRNLVSRDYATVNGNTITLAPQYRAGVAYNHDWVTVALDADLNENDPVGFESPSQMIALGLEFNIFNFLQLRTGYLHNLKAAANIDEPGSYTAGVGLNVFGVHVDAAAMTNGNDNDLGVYAQLGVNF